MDFEKCFFECCKACNCLNENFHLPREIQGQGDCNASIGVQDDQNVWMSAGNEKTHKAKVREKDKSSLTAGKQKELQDFYCDCVKKTNLKQNHKYKHEAKLENKNSNVFEDSNNPWNFPYASWNNSKPDKIYVSDEPNPYIPFNSNRVLAETVVELKEKVDILFQIFRGCGEKLPSGGYEKPSQIKAAGAVFGNFWHLFDFNKRLSATEDGIQKLTFIIEDLLNKWNKKKPPEDIPYRNPLSFEEMSIGERINFLKTRNDLLLSLMRDFFKVGSVEEICSRLALLPKKNSEVNPVFLGSELHYNEKGHGHCLSKEELMDTLKKLRAQFPKIQENKSQNSNQLHSARNERRENSQKFFGSKLEVISEQAELALNHESENTNLDNLGKKNFQNLKENFPRANEGTEKSDVNIYEVTSRLLAQEALLKSSLDKVHFELFSKLDTSEKKYAKENQSVINKVEIPKKEENYNGGLGTNFDSLGSTKDNGCIYCDSDHSEKSKSNGTAVVNEKFVKVKEFKEPIKETNNSLESVSENLNLPKQSIPVSNKKSDECQESKPKTFRKTLHKNSFTILSPASRPKRIDNCLSERCSSSSREGTKNEVEVKDKRPLTAPNSISKIMPPSGLKPPVSEKSRGKNLGLNNVKNKNKILLSKKSFVETS